MMRSQPFRVFTLQVMANSSPGMSAKWANGLLSLTSAAFSSSGTGLNSTPA